MSELPNVLIVLTDQQSLWTLSCYGASEIQTPNADRLASEGARFANYFTNSACCTPSRGCFFTGLYPHAHGAYFNDLPIRQDIPTLGRLARENGYDTSYVGKWHLDGDWNSLLPAMRACGVEPPDLPAEERVSKSRDARVAAERAMGFDDCRSMFNCSHAKRVIDHADGSFEFVAESSADEGRYMTDWLTDKAISIVRGRSAEPFFLTLAIPDPHDPFTVRAPYDTMFDPAAMTVPETFHQTELPDWMHSDLVDRWHRPTGVVGSEDSLRRTRAQYLGEAACIDENLGRILHALETEEILDDTIVVFTTDHGEYMGEHGIYAKNQLYESAYHIPFILRYPAKVAAGGVLDSFVTTVDILPTIAGLAGIPTSGTEQGRDAAPLLLDGYAGNWVNQAFIYGTLKDRVGIITPEYELAYVNGARDHVLFDRQDDPLQETNLFHAAAYSDVVANLTSRILEHCDSVGAPEASWLAELSKLEYRNQGSENG